MTLHYKLDFVIYKIVSSLFIVHFEMFISLFSFTEYDRLETLIMPSYIWKAFRAVTMLILYPPNIMMVPFMANTLWLNVCCGHACLVDLIVVLPTLYHSEHITTPLKITPVHKLVSSIHGCDLLIYLC